MEDKKAVVRQYIEGIVSTGDTSQIASVIADDYRDMLLSANESCGVNVAKTHIEAIRSTYPDLNVAVLEQYCDGDMVITMIRAAATHSGKWLNIKPTKKRIEIEGVNIDEVVNGKIVTHKGFANTLEALIKINALPGVGIS